MHSEHVQCKDIHSKRKVADVYFQFTAMIQIEMSGRCGYLSSNSVSREAEIRQVTLC